MHFAGSPFKQNSRHLIDRGASGDDIIHDGDGGTGGNLYCRIELKSATQVLPALCCTEAGLVWRIPGPDHQLWRYGNTGIPG